MPNTLHLLLLFGNPSWLSRRSQRPGRPWASSFATSFGASFGLGLSLGFGSNCIMGKLTFVSICALPESVVSTRASRSRGHRSCGGSRRRLLILLLVSFLLCCCSLALTALGRFGSHSAGQCGGPVRELLSYNFVLSTLDLTACRFIKVIVLSPLRIGRRSFDTHEQRSKGSKFAKLSL